jgi:hypothetical protein
MIHPGGTAGSASVNMNLEERNNRAFLDRKRMNASFSASNSFFSPTLF